MRVILFAVVLTVLSVQYAKARVNYDSSDSIKIKSLTFQQNERAIKDVWNNIKNSAKNVWISIKNIADSTKSKIKQWIGDVQVQAQNVKDKMKDQIQEIREKSKIALEKLLGTGKLVKECFQEESEALEELLKQIVQYVTTCIANSLNDLIHLEKSGFQFDPNLNETIFMNDLENKMNKCILNEGNPEECLYKIREEMYLSMENMEREVLANGAEARGIVDDLLVAVVNCAIKGLIDASNAIAEESIQIITCVVKG